MNLCLLQLGDSALPIGGYSHSWGLEAAIERGSVREAGSLERWTRLWLTHSVAPSEGVVVAAVNRAVHDRNWREVLRANELLWCSIAPPTLRHASRDLGQQLMALAHEWPWSAEIFTALEAELPRNAVEWHHAVAFAILAAAAGAAPEDALSVYFHQAAMGVISAGVRAIPIGHTHGQQVLARLQQDIAALARAYCDRDLDTAGSFCPAHEMFCHAQTHLYTRLFRS
jgi:urease accessory protein